MVGLGSLASVACSSEPSMDERMAEQGLARLEVAFSAVVGAEPWRCDGVYQMGSPPSEARPSHLRLFVHDLAVIGSDGQAAPLVLEESEWQGNFDDVGHTVALLDFDDATGNCRYTDPEVHTTISGWAPVGRDYTGLSFRIGVPTALNHLDAGLAPPPMNRPGMWWSWNDGHITLRAEFDTVSSSSHREVTADDTTNPGGWQLWLAETVFGECSEDAPTQFNCPDEQQPQVVLEAFDAAADRVELDFGALFSDVDLARTEFDVEPEGAEPPITDPTITPYPMPDYYAGFFMDRIDGEGAVILNQLGIDWMSLTPPDPARQVFARRGAR
jgi:uncharacterized repeat protein (TIGR04052 family)